MPLASKAQFRKFKVLEREGKVAPGTASEWYHHTDNFDSLPEHKKAIESLHQLAKEGNTTAQAVIATLKQSASVGRNEGFGATNSMVTAGSSLMNPANLSKPPEPIPGQPGQPPVPLAKRPPQLAPGFGSMAGQAMQQFKPAPPVTGGPPVTAGNLSSPIKMH